MSEPAPAKCHCGSRSWGKEPETSRYTCVSCYRPLWMPIASAPKDGTTILAVWKDDNRITMIEWFNVAGVDGSWSQAVPGLGADHGYSDDAFTHWMLLPEPPKLD